MPHPHRRFALVFATFVCLSTGCSNGCEEAQPSAPPAVDHLHFGTYHVCTLDDQNTVWCTGENAVGQLGDGTTSKRADLTEVADLGPMTGLAVGYFDTTCAWNDDGELYCWGNNTHGAVGHDEHQPTLRPRRVEDLPPVIDVSLGAYHSCAVTEQAELYCWGNNSSGQLGIGYGQRAIVDTPTRVDDLEAVQQVRTGGEYTCALTQEGNLYCWGRNDHNQLGIPDIPGTASPQQVGSSLATIVDFDVSFRHACAVVGERRELYCWGNNDYGQLGLDDLEGRATPTAIPEIAYVDELATAGGQVCVRIDDEVHCAGEILRPVKAARQTGEGYFFRRSPSLAQTTELWSGVLAICGRSDEDSIACRGVQHKALAGDIF